MPRPRTRPQASTVLHLHFRREWLMGLAALMLVPWLVVVWILAGERSTPANRPTRSIDRESVMAEVSPAQGPWGQLVLTEIRLAPPPELIDWFQTSDTMNPWHFEECTLEGLQKFMAAVPCTDEQRYQILASAEPQASIEGFIVKPPIKVVASLSTDARRAIYNRLSVFDLNVNQMNASRFRGDSVDDWFRGTDLPQELVERVRQLAYRNGHFLFFADLPLVSHDLDEKTRGELIKVLAREMTYMVKVRIDDDTDIEKLVAYWGRGGRSKDVGPLLESLARIEGGVSLDVTHLLPGFARRYLYTYPTASAALLDDNVLYSRDCHWTAANFFNDVIDDRYAKATEYRDFVEDNYYEIFADPTFGDLVVFEQGGVAYHSAVYLADDLVFTKNGSKLSRPWMLLRMEEMEDFYPRPDSMGPIQKHYMRRNDL